MNTHDFPPIVPFGKIKSFGPYGPKYEVGDVTHQEDGEWMVEIVLVESGEKTSYRWSHMMDDPDAQ